MTTVYVFIALHGGLLSECIAFSMEPSAMEEATKYCKHNDIPTEDNEKEGITAWHDDNNDVYVQEVDIIIG